MLLTLVRARLPRLWIMMMAVALCAGALDGCGGLAQAVTARTYGVQVSAVCERYNAETAQIGRQAHGSREHETQLAHATNVVTVAEARTLMQIPRPAGFGRLERLYQEMTVAANAADEATRLFSAGELGKANAASMNASHELGAVNEGFRRLGLPVCAE
jgi:hypothetical protein